MEPKDKKRMSPIEMEKKRQLLPHLDTVEYIQMQLNHRLTKDSSITATERTDVCVSKGPFLMKQFPRFCQHLSLQDAPFGREQSLHWLMQLIEGAYEAHSKATKRKDNSKSFPVFVFEYLHQQYGLNELASQAGWDMIITTNQILKNWPEIKLLDFYGTSIHYFVEFLCESLDNNALHFYLTCRGTLEGFLKLKLSQENKTLTREHRDSGVFITTRTCMLDEVYFNKNACHLCSNRLFRSLGASDADINRYQKYFVRNIIFKVERERLNHIDFLEDRESNTGKNIVISSAHFLRCSILHFQNIPEDIIRSVKYADDGKRMQVLDRLQRTSQTEKRRQELLQEHTECSLELKSLKVQVDTLEKKSSLCEEKRKQYKTTLFLANNSFWRKQHEMDSIDNELQSIQQSADEVWDSIVAPKKPTFKEEDVGFKMYLEHLDRQVSGEEVKVKAVKRLRAVDGWRDQLEIRREEAAILLQRIYRERKRLRLLEQDAKDAAELKRKEHRQRKLQEKRQLLVQAEQRHKHKNRLINKDNQAQQLHEQSIARQNNMIRKHRVAEAERRLQRCNLSLLGRCFGKWNMVVKSARMFKAQMKRTMRRRFRQWIQFKKFRKMLNKKRDVAATKIQKIARSLLAKNWCLKLRAHRDAMEEKIRVNTFKMLNRNVGQAFRSWHLYTAKMKQAAHLMQRHLKSNQKEKFESWRKFLEYSRSYKFEAAVVIQRYARRFLSKRILNRLQLRRQNVIIIQSAWRSFMCKTIMERAKEYQMRQEAKIAKCLKRMRWKTLYNTFQALSCMTQKLKKVRIMFHNQLCRTRRRTFDCWFEWKQNWQSLKNISATKIQSRFRGKVVRKDYLYHRQRHRGANAIQTRYRGMRARRQVHQMYWEDQSARLIQRVYRGSKDRVYFDRVLKQYLLHNAKPANYSLFVHAFEKRCIDPNNVIDSSTGDTLLHCCSRSGAKRILKLCLRSGMKLNTTNLAKRTCLHELSSVQYLGQEALADYLMSKGCDINARDENGYIPLMEAASIGNVNLTEFFTEYADLEIKDFLEGNTALQIAVNNDQLSIVQLLLRAGSDPKCRDMAEKCPLHDLAQNNLTEIMSVLLPLYCGDDALDISDNKGRTPLHYAVAEGAFEAMKMLILWGATPAVEDSKGRIPLWYAARRGDIECLKYLLESDSPSDTRCCETGATALHCACNLNDKTGVDHIAVAKHLLLSGCLPNVQDSKGDLPIHIAARTNDVDLVRLLVFYDCDMNIKNYAGKTALGEARLRGCKEVEEYILKKYIMRDEQYQAEKRENTLNTCLSHMNNSLLTAKPEEVKTEEPFIGPELSMDEWIDMLEQHSILQFEFGVLTNSPWHQYLISDTSSIGTGESYWYCPKTNVFQWKTPAEFVDLPNEQSLWEQKWDQEIQRAYFFNTITKDTVYPATSSQAPPGRAAKFLEKRVQKKITRTNGEFHDEDDLDFADDDGIAVNASDYQNYWHEENRQVTLKLKQEKAALLIQAHYRRYISSIRAWRLRLLRDMAIKLQVRWRMEQSRRRTNRIRKEIHAVKVLQRSWRAFFVRIWFKIEKKKLELSRKKLLVTPTIQRFLRGHKARKRVRLIRARTISPAPRTQEDWDKLMLVAKLEREFRLWQAYLLKYPDVRFYRNRVSEICSWDKPSELDRKDHEEYQEFWQVQANGYTLKELRFAVKLQNIYRGKRIREQFRLMVKGVNIMRNAEDTYLNHPFRSDAAENDLEGMVNLCNYTLHLHVVEHDMDKARELYYRAMRFMVSRGPDNAFVLLGFACFLAAGLEEEFDIIMDYVQRAYLADPEMKAFRIAEAGFFRQITLDRPKDARGLLNYALCLQFFGTSLSRKVKIQPDYELAEHYYILAIAADPHDSQIVENFNYMLKNLKGESYDAFTAFTRYQEQLGLAEIAKQKKSEFQQLHDSCAILIQKHMRGFLGKNKVKRLVHSEWEEVFDGATSTSFFYSKTSGVSRWTPPFGFIPSTAIRSDETWIISQDENGYSFYFNPSTNESSWKLPLGFTTISSGFNGWEQHSTEEGEVYYYNSLTGESSWEDQIVPVTSCPIRFINPFGRFETLQDQDGNSFYHNNDAGTSQWTVPIELLLPGTFVDVQYNQDSFCFPARISRIDDGVLYVTFDDGGEEHKTHVDLLALREPPKLSLNQRCKMKLPLESGCHEGTIYAVTGSSYSLSLEDGREEHDVPGHFLTASVEGQNSWTYSECGLPYYRTATDSQWEYPIGATSSPMDQVNQELLQIFHNLETNGFLQRDDLLKLHDNESPLLGLFQDKKWLNMLVALHSATDQISAEEFSESVVSLCKEFQLCRDLENLFLQLKLDQSNNLEKEQLKLIMSMDDVLQFVRSSPSISMLLRPPLFLRLLENLPSNVNLKDFTSLAKGILTK